MNWGLDAREGRRMLRMYQALRLAGFAILAASLAWLVGSDGAQLPWAVVGMALGAAVATLGVLWLGRFETRRDAETKRAVRLLVAGFGLKAFAIPTVALGGGWLAWGGSPSLVAAVAVVVLGVAAYVYGLVARIDGLSLLPTGSQYA